MTNGLELLSLLLAFDFGKVLGRKFILELGAAGVLVAFVALLVRRRGELALIKLLLIMNNRLLCFGLAKVYVQAGFSTSPVLFFCEARGKL